MKCKFCNSNNLKIIQRGIHLELVCNGCLKFQKFISKKEAKRFIANPIKEVSDGETA